MKLTALQRETIERVFAESQRAEQRRTAAFVHLSDVCTVLAGEGWSLDMNDGVKLLTAQEVREAAESKPASEAREDTRDG